MMNNQYTPNSNINGNFPNQQSFNQYYGQPNQMTQPYNPVINQNEIKIPPTMLYANQPIGYSTYPFYNQQPTPSLPQKPLTSSNDTLLAPPHDNNSIAIPMTQEQAQTPKKTCQQKLITAFITSLFLFFFLVFFITFFSVMGNMFFLMLSN
ncbi:hypothetical protein ENU1_195840 [Entamoeba nuttalli P19]|uniref:Uncharacterized protein n=2 Tax=Entamoeba nuttalli TaxID=412467 RepID=K2G578_ENTNP|nr:hypothetical protein ENU1_195840 [Entamoeba nuttalli P19]EKE37486.1 hypothetical protein ENU1_195840 [Entamoeba nuttalli P19]|eukprot:XP_008860174.1 hypothetical protein ENU1_195840 [Entamoeba nuttalli P19]